VLYEYYKFGKHEISLMQINKLTNEGKNRLGNFGGLPDSAEELAKNGMAFCNRSRRIETCIGGDFTGMTDLIIIRCVDFRTKSVFNTVCSMTNLLKVRTGLITIVNNYSGTVEYCK
jgi:hypothetical protein